MFCQQRLDKTFCVAQSRAHDLTNGFALSTPNHDSQDPTRPVGERILFWLARACKEARGATPPEQIAVTAQLRARTVDRFEKAEHWPRDLEVLTAAYAQAGGLDDARELWDRALDLWYEHGTAPTLSRRDASRADVQVVDAVAEAAKQHAALQRRQARRAPAAEPKPSRKQRPAGG